MYSLSSSWGSHKLLFCFNGELKQKPIQSQTAGELSCETPAKTQQGTATTEMQGHRRTLPPRCLWELLILCSLLATLSDDYLENSFKTPSAVCQQKRFKNPSFHWTQPRESPPQQTQSLTQPGHIKTLLLSLICTNFGPNPWTDITGLQTTPRTLNGAAKAGGRWAKNCSAPGTGSTSGTGFSPCKPAQDLLLAPSNALSDSFCKLVPAVLPLCSFGSCITF